MGRWHPCGLANETAWLGDGGWDAVEREYRRGFVAEVGCTLAALFGGELCPSMCLGTGVTAGKPCTTCDGAGRTRSNA